MDTQQIISELEAERDRLQQAIDALRPNGTKSGKPDGRKRRLSPAAKKRISDAMKARWAERKKKVVHAVGHSHKAA